MISEGVKYMTKKVKKRPVVVKKSSAKMGSKPMRRCLTSKRGGPPPCFAYELMLPFR